MIPEIINNQIKKYNRQELEIFNNLFFKNSFFENELSKDGLYKQYFDPNKHSFPSITKDIISKIVEKKLNCDLEDIHKNINENLDINLDLPQSLFEQETQAPAFVPPEVSKIDTGPGSVVTGQGPTVQGQGSTNANVDARFRQGTITDPTNRAIAGLD